MRKMESTGSITLYLAVTLGIMLSLVFTLIEGVRRQTIRLETEGVMDLGLFSVFGEYNRQLLDQYDLFFIDTAYGGKTPELEKTEERLRYYMNENFQKTLTGVGTLRDLTELRCDNVTLTAYMRASDAGGALIKSQIREYELAKTGIPLLEKAMGDLELIRAQGWNGRDVEGEWDQVQGEIDSYLEQKRTESQEQGEQQDFYLENPADQVRQTRGTAVLYKAFPEGKTISVERIEPAHYFSRRQPLVGNGQMITKASVLEQAVGRWMLWEYLMEKCGCYGKEMEKNVLSYQLEYILKRQPGDDANLEAVITDIFRLRMAANIAFLLSDQSRQAQAELVSSIICTAIVLPELIEPVKLSILYAWCYAESVRDIRILLDGNRVSLIKREEEWNTPLSQLAAYRTFLGDYKETKQGLTYMDYLGIFFLMEKEDYLMEGFMDICEMDIRQTKGNEFFRIDGCLGAIQAKVNVSSGYGPGYEITRSYSY